jgi:polygalacturonase
LQTGDIPGSIIEDGTITDAMISPTAAISASKLNFLQAGPSAIDRSIESKLKDTVSIKDFGAVGDGSDATAEIQAAVNTGSAVIIPPGEYLVSSTISVPSNAQIIGLGGTIVRASSPLGLVLFSTSNTENVAFNNVRFKVAEGTSTAQAGGFIGANYCNSFRVKIKFLLSL